MSGGITNKTYPIFKLIRVNNLLFLLYLQSSVFLLLFLSSDIGVSHFWSGILGFLIPTMIIAAFGNAVNDYFDLESDSLNHKRSNKSTTNNPDKIKRICKILVATAIFSMVLSLITTSNLTLLTLFGLSLLLLYFYSYKLKCIPLIGNIVISGLCVLALIMPSIYIIAITGESVITGETRVFLSGYLSFVFLITLTRELVKDLEDLRGDRATDCNTLPVSIGESKSRNIALAICIITILMIMSWAQYFGIFVNAFVMLFCVFPLILVAAIIVRTLDYGKVSKYLKWLMFSSSLLIYIFHFSYNS